MSITPQFEHIARSVCSQNDLVFHQYVGKGAFKETYLVHLPDGTPCAMKICNPSSTSPRTQREIDAMLRCNHANIAKLLTVDQFSYAGQDFLVFCEEYIAGGTIGSYLQINGLMSRQSVVDIGNVLISSVAHIASLDLVHRDIKPENVMFRKDGITPVIVDFGLVRNLADTSLTQTWLMQGPGTPLYASPEQLNNDKFLIDWRSDQFSLGVLLSYCLFGYHPYELDGDNNGLIVEHVANRTGPSTRFLEDTVKANVVSLATMVNSWPVHRFRTPMDLQYSWTLRS